MKYLKIFEDFNNSIEDNIEDVKWIVVQFNNDKSPKLINNIEDRFFHYKIDEIGDLEVLGAQLMEIRDYRYLINDLDLYIGLNEYIDIVKKCLEYEIENFTINNDRLVDVEGDVNLSYLELTKLPIKFGSVGGSFWCNNNKLTTLEGCPKSVGGNFFCSNNKLTTLEGCPKSVGGDFWCHNNQLTSLEGCPKSVGGGFWCYNNQLTSLEGSPDSVGGDFFCSNNKLTTLESCPNSVGGDFFCNNNQLTTLGGLGIVGGDFFCDNNVRHLVPKNIKLG